MHPGMRPGMQRDMHLGPEMAGGGARFLGRMLDLAKATPEQRRQIHQIMDALKGHPLEAFDRSIDVHISRIRALIEDDPKAPKRVLTVRGAGYVFAKKQDAE